MLDLYGQNPINKHLELATAKTLLGQLEDNLKETSIQQQLSLYPALWGRLYGSYLKETSMKRLN